MARLARVVVPGIPHHIIQRGNRRQNVFFSDEDKQAYIGLLSHYAPLHSISIWAYCLMDNHVHIIAAPSDERSFARGIGEAHRMYSRMINFREGWRGYLWQGRFLSYPLDEDHLFAAVRYTERNPVRANIVGLAEDYKWSSAKAHILGTKDELLSGEEVDIMGINDWQSYLRSVDDEGNMESLRKYARTGRPLGGDNFIKKLESITGRTLRKQKTGPKKKIECP